MSLKALWILFTSLSLLVVPSHSLIPPCASHCQGASLAQASFLSNKPSSRPTLTRRYNFFKNLVEKAFENDPSLIDAADKTVGQLDDSQSDDNANQNEAKSNLTPTQVKWQQTLQAQKIPDISGKTLTMDFYLAGVPERDPSSDLYASRTNISSRDRTVGLTLPTQPTVKSIQVKFLEGGVCLLQTESPFTQGNVNGDWMLLTDGASATVAASGIERMIRFRIPVTGYSRTVETKGTIQNVYWSQRAPDKDPEIRQTSTTYSIPPGLMYGDFTISKSSRGMLIVSNGVLKIEKTTGFLGVATKMVPCGKFEATVEAEAIQ